MVQGGPTGPPRRVKGNGSIPRTTTGRRRDKGVDRVSAPAVLEADKGDFGTARSAFPSLDLNHDGIISSDELKKAASSLLTLDRDQNGGSPSTRFTPAALRDAVASSARRDAAVSSAHQDAAVSGRRVAVSLARRWWSVRPAGCHLDRLPVAVVRRTEPKTPMDPLAADVHRRPMTTTARPRLTMRRRPRRRRPTNPPPDQSSSATLRR